MYKSEHARNANMLPYRTCFKLQHVSTLNMCQARCDEKERSERELTEEREQCLYSLIGLYTHFFVQ